MSKKKVILIGLICLLLIGGVIVALSLKSGAPEETILPESPKDGAVVKQPVEEPVKEPTKEPASQPIEMTVIQLSTEYHTNQITAERKYLNKVLRISGYVGQIRRDFSTGKPCVEIYELSGNYEVSIFCVFENEEEVVPLSRQQKVVVEGKFVGDKLEAVLRMENCSLVK